MALRGVGGVIVGRSLPQYKAIPGAAAGGAGSPLTGVWSLRKNSSPPISTTRAARIMDAATVVFKLIIKFLLADNNRPGGGKGRRLGGGRAEFLPAEAGPGCSRPKPGGNRYLQRNWSAHNCGGRYSQC